MGPEEHRKKTIRAMEAVAILLCVIFFVVGSIIAKGMGSFVLDLGVKIASIGLLAFTWWAIPGVYERHFKEFGAGDGDSEGPTSEEP